MQQETQNRLLQYAALSVAAVSGLNADAQVVYTNIEPDVLLYEDVYDDEGWQYFDLNDDGLVDVALSFHIHYGCGYCPYLTFFNVAFWGGCEIATVIAPPLSLFSTFQSTYSSTVPECYIPERPVARGFTFADTIDAAADFAVIDDVFSTHMCGYNGDSGIQIDIDCWGDADKPYLGFSVPKDGGVQYAWLRLFSDDDDRLWVTDMAVQSTVNAPLDIFIPEVDVAESVDPQITVFSAGNLIHVANAAGFQMELFNMQGASVFRSQITNDNYNEVVNLPAGPYVSLLHNGNIRFSQVVVFAR